MRGMAKMVSRSIQPRGDLVSQRRASMAPISVLSAERFVTADIETMKVITTRTCSKWHQQQLMLHAQAIGLGYFLAAILAHQNTKEVTSQLVSPQAKQPRGTRYVLAMEQCLVASIICMIGFNLQCRLSLKSFQQFPARSSRRQSYSTTFCLLVIRESRALPFTFYAESNASKINVSSRRAL